RNINVRLSTSITVWTVLLGMSAGTDAFAGSSNSLMDVSPDGSWLLIANPDNSTVTLIDTKAKKAIREIRVGEKPEGIAWIGNGPEALVTLYHEDHLVFLNALDGRVTKKLRVPDEPYGVVTNRAGTRAWVTHEYPGLVSEIDLQQK